MKLLSCLLKSCYKNVKFRVICGVILCGVTIRLLPYLTPIRAEDILQEDVALTFSDRHGLPLGTLLTPDQDHTAVVPLNQVSPHFLQAIVAAEDKRYYQHGAVDTVAIARAILEAAQARQIMSGASTITMQLARMLEPAPRTLQNKVGEIWLSWRLSAGMNKQEILQAYINRLPMGGNLYGVEAAARTYFNLPANDLNLAQATLLAAIPNDPNNLSPYEDWDSLKQRQQYVLDRMVDDEYITQRQADQTYQEQVYLQTRQRATLKAPHFLFWVASQIINNNSETALTNVSPIRTSLDLPLQQFVETQVTQILAPLKANNVHHAAAIVINNHTGEILAYVGSPDYFDLTNQGRNDGVQALRQPGSTLKPFLYQLALEKRIIQPNTILPDIPTHYAIPGAKLYSPTDYSETFLGPVRVRVALANSLNIPAVRTLEKISVPVFLERLHQLGFKHLNHSPDYYGLGLTLGSGEVNLMELAQAYLTVARQGKGINLAFLKNQPIQAQIPLTDDPQSWLLITDILADSHARATAFGVQSVLSLPFPVAVKTGTSSDYRDTWTVGFTTDYTVATWVGNFNGQPMQKISGVTGAAPLWQQIVLYLHEQKRPAALPQPQLKKLPICAISGFRPSVDCPAATVLEYFYPEGVSEYRSHSGKFELGTEYNEWLIRQPDSILAPKKLRITFPQPNDYFILKPGENSRLELKISGHQDRVDWFMNGEKLVTQLGDSFFWEMRPGEWKLSVKSGEIEDQITFQVQEVDKIKTRRGFSVNSNP